uniref:Protein krueppel n=1 Tax=Anopheles atroparvus TaxID=41427 RepID=A0AAG5DT55_ANOAO
MEISHKCRVCLDYSSTCTSLFSKHNGASVAQMISFCAGVQITEEDDLPPYACERCCKEATLAYMFVNKCRKSDAELRTQQILGRATEDVPGERSDCLENVLLSEEHSEVKNEAAYLALELCAVETLEETDGNASVHSWQDRTEDNECEEVEDDTNDCEMHVEEYLDDSDTERTAQPSIGPEEGNTEKTGVPSKWNRSNQRTVGTYVCCHTECKITFDTKHMLQEHLHALHQADERKRKDANDTAHNRCRNCDESFPSEGELNVHENRLKLKQAALSRRRFGRPRLYPSSVFDAPEKICCGCFERFPTTEALLAHSETTHAVRKTATDPTRPVQCQICYKLFRSEALVRTHRIAVYKPRNHCCTDCGSSYSTASKLASHQAQHHSGRVYVCEECGTHLKSEQNLKMHGLLHREKREVCKTCGLRFHRKSNLKMHQRIHEDTFYHVCPNCPKQLKTLTQLKEHLKVHTKEKPYGCRYCDKRFRYFSDRSRHEMVHTGNYPFECSTCLKKFARSLSYYRHVSKCTQVNGASGSQSECGNDS